MRFHLLAPLILVSLSAIAVDKPNCDPNAGLVDGTCATIEQPSQPEEAQLPKSGEGIFAVAHHSCGDSESETAKPKPSCVVGTLPSDKKAFILGQSSSQTCQSKIGETIQIDHPIAGGHYAVTRIETGQCKNLPFQLVFLGNSRPQYRVFPPSLVRVTNPGPAVLKSLRDQITRLESDVGELRFKLSSNPPLLFRFPSQAQDTFIASFLNTAESEDPTHVFYSKGHAELILGAAELVSVFSLNGRSFVHYKFSCKVGCGFHGNIVVEFSGTTFRFVMVETAGST
jgi:hypothetical protein